MYLTYSVYALLIALLLWGGKFAGIKKNQFHEDSASLESMKSLRGFAAICVILHHISQEYAFQMVGGENKPGELAIFVNAGYLMVSIFFFCSGFGLIKSLETKSDYLKGFIKKRVVKTLVIPYYVSVIIYTILRFAIGEKLPAGQWITGLLGISMINLYAWYPIVAAILYTAFYLIFKNIKNQKICFGIMATFIIILGMIFCVNGHFAWWAGEKNWWLTDAGWNNAKWWMQEKLWWFSGEWWINSCPALFIGMLFARFETQIRNWFRSFYLPKFLLVLLITFGTLCLSVYGQSRFGWWSEFEGNGPDIGNKIITYFCQITFSMSFVIMIFVIMLKYKVSNPVSRFFGKISLETYMMNLIAISAFYFLIYRQNGYYGSAPYYKAGNYNLAIYLVAVFASSIVLGLIYKFLCSLIQRLIK